MKVEELIKVTNTLNRCKTLSAAIAAQTTGDAHNMATMLEIMIKRAGNQFFEGEFPSHSQGPDSDPYVNGYAAALDDLAEYFTHAQERRRYESKQG